MKPTLKLNSGDKVKQRITFKLLVCSLALLTRNKDGRCFCVVFHNRSLIPYYVVRYCMRGWNKIIIEWVLNYAYDAKSTASPSKSVFVDMLSIVVCLATSLQMYSRDWKRVIGPICSLCFGILNSNNSCLVKDDLKTPWMTTNTSTS